jgi:hypothetical protein
MLRRILGLMILLAVAGLLAPAAASAEKKAERKQLTPIKEWKGSVADEALAREAPANGVIADAKTLEKLWKAWKVSDNPPAVDFKNELVLVSTTRGSRLSLAANVDEKGDLMVLGIATDDLRPGFRYVLITVKREGIKTVGGKPLPE